MRIRRAVPERRESLCRPSQAYAAVAGMAWTAWARRRLLPARGDQKWPSDETGGAAPGLKGPGAGRDRGGGGVRAERRPGRDAGRDGTAGPGPGSAGKLAVEQAAEGGSGTPGALRDEPEGSGAADFRGRRASRRGCPAGVGLQSPGLLSAWDTCARLRPRPPRGPEGEHHLTQDLPAGCHLRPRPHLSGQRPRPPQRLPEAAAGEGEPLLFPESIGRHGDSRGRVGGVAQRKGGVAAGRGTSEGCQSDVMRTAWLGDPRGFCARDFCKVSSLPFFTPYIFSSPTPPRGKVFKTLRFQASTASF